MNEAIALTGFLAAHAIWCVSQGQSLTIPLLVVENEGGNTRFIVVEGQSSEEAVARAERLLDQQGPGTLRAVMAFEAYLNLSPGKTDAIFLHARQYLPDAQELYVAVPFRASTSRGGFAVFRPKFLAYEDNLPPPGALDAFRRGVTLNPPGAEVWREHMDESR